MKKETVFDIGTPIEEMETTTYRTTQRGQPIPMVGGIPINSPTGYSVNPFTGQQFAQQATFGNFISTPASQGYGQPVTPQYPYGGSPFVNQPQQNYPYGLGTTQQAQVAGTTPGYVPNTFQNPYLGFQNPLTTPPYPGFAGTTIPATGLPQGAGVPFTQPLGVPFNQPIGVPFTQQFGVPFTQPMTNGLPVQGTPNYQAAINIVDGQPFLVPVQAPQTFANSVPSSKNGERDFVSWIPTVNITETEKTFKIELCVPGVTKENCRISIDKNNILRISGTRKWNQDVETVGVTRKEFTYGTFVRSFLLTEDLQADQITSSCRNGLLTITIPKEEESEGYERRGDSEISVN